MSLLELTVTVLKSQGATSSYDDTNREAAESISYRWTNKDVMEMPLDAFERWWYGPAIRAVRAGNKTCATPSDQGRYELLEAAIERANADFGGAAGDVDQQVRIDADAVAVAGYVYGGARRCPGHAQAMVDDLEIAPDNADAYEIAHRPRAVWRRQQIGKQQFDGVGCVSVDFSPLDVSQAEFEAAVRVAHQPDAGLDDFKRRRRDHAAP